MVLNYSKWDAIGDSDDDDAKTQPAAKPGPPKKSIDQQLLEAYNSDPSKIDELEKNVKDVRLKLEEAKRLRDLANTPPPQPGQVAKGIKKAVSSQSETLTDELAALQRQQASLDAQAAKLRQLEQCGDQAALLDFFAGEGLSHEQIQRGLTGDAEAMFAQLAETEKATETDGERKSREALALADQLEQRQPTADDRNLVVTVSLPGVAKGATKLDISESDIRLWRPRRRAAARDREYRLNAKLARRVLSDQAKAKWKSKAEQLVVTIPTLAGH
ncbi:hypothetical protein SO694_00012492 [Aureococcus anophagefferens]|uniref:PIH1D1/2/3 CS-like domain-containing protein n=1 Tax=Aureococcus anophagefferens TaxID=44056 RepID=A0ABR1G1F2_AURAN